MRRPWFTCRPVDESFFEDAPVILEETFEVPRPAAAVWADLTSDAPLSWCRILDEVRWTSPRPFGPGTTRVVRSLRGASVLEERYFLWEEARRHSFHVVRASAPLFRALAEDYLIEPISEASCRFTWTIAYAPRPLARPGNPLNKRILGTLFRDTARHYGID